MALQVWLPLKGDLNNQGLSNIIFTNTGVSINDNGKIGKCYHFNADQYIKESTYDWTNFNTSEFSLCCWYKEPSPVASGNSQIICIGTSSGWNNIRIGLLRRTSNGYPMFSVSDGSTAIQYNFTASTFTLDTWNHIAVTYNNGELKMYLNGTLNKTSATTIVPVLNNSQHLGIGAASNGAEKLTGFLNDVRIYDHALSAKEVEEISKGLILHYKLDNNGLGGKNYLTNSSFRTKINNFPTVASQYTQTFEVIDGYECFHIHSDTLGVNSSVGWQVKDFINAYPIGTKFTFSGWIKTENIVKGTTNYFASLYYGGSYNNNGTSTWIGEGSRIKANPSSSSAFDLSGQGWKYCYIVSTFTRNDYTGMSALYYLRDWIGDIYLRNFKLEVSDEPTPWTPNKKDLGIEENIIYDCSGYQNNGIIYGNVDINNDSTKYLACTYFPSGNTDYIVTESPVGNPQDAITMNIWFKSSNKSPGSSYHHMFNGLTSWCYIEMAVHSQGYLRCGLYINGIRYVANTNNNNLLDGNWHMLTMTYDGANIKRYVDAELKNTQAATGNIDRPNDKFIFGHGASTGYYCKEAYLSDARIYATALTAEQIKELYDTSASVDKNGNIYAREAIEI